MFEEIIKTSKKIEKLDKNDEDNENLIIDEKKYIEKLAYGISNQKKEIFHNEKSENSQRLKRTKKPYKKEKIKWHK